MNAVRELMAALVDGGMDPIDAAVLVARAGAELAVPKKSAGAVRQQRYRDRNETSQNVTQEGDAGGHGQASQTVTKRNDVTERDDALSYIGSKKEISSEVKSKSPKSPKRNAVAIPDDWTPSDDHRRLALELGVDIGKVEAAFRDYIESHGRRYVSYDAGFRTFLRNEVKFGNGKPPRGNRTNPASGHATAREADFVAAMGRGAAGQLEKGQPPGREREIPGDTDPPAGADPDERTESRDRFAFRVIG